MNKKALAMAKERYKNYPDMTFTTRGNIVFAIDYFGRELALYQFNDQGDIINKEEYTIKKYEIR